MVRRVVLGHAVRLSSCSTARRIHDETERIVAHFTTVTPTSDRGARAPVGPLIGTFVHSAACQGGSSTRFELSCRIADVSHFDFASPGLRPRCSEPPSRPNIGCVRAVSW